jgi:SOS-response transcriptional repressor LexA
VTPFQLRRDSRGITPPRQLGYRQYQVCRFVEAYAAEHGIEPSYDRICDETGISTKGEVSRIVSALEIRGIFARRNNGTPRIKLLTYASR